MDAGLQEFRKAVEFKHRNPNQAFEHLKNSAILGFEKALDSIVWAKERGWKEETFEWCLEFFKTNGLKNHLAFLVNRSEIATIGPKLAYRYGYALHVCGANNNTKANLYLYGYEAKSRRTKAAIGAWIGVAIRRGICRDIRRLIGSLIWEDRYYSKPIAVPVFRPNKRRRNGR